MHDVNPLKDINYSDQVWNQQSHIFRDLCAHSRMPEYSLSGYMFIVSEHEFRRSGSDSQRKQAGGHSTWRIQ